MTAQYSLRLAGFNIDAQWRSQLLKTPRSNSGAILLAGVIAGTIDIGAAALINTASICCLA
jgi:hypothetical protein